MNDYTHSTTVKCIILYGVACSDGREDQRINAANNQTFSAFYNRLRETGTFKVNIRDTGRERSVEELVL